MTDLLSVYSNLQPKIIWHPDCVFCFGHAIKQETVGFRAAVSLLILSLYVFLILLDTVDEHLVLEVHLPESPFITLLLTLNPG